jgi:LuxR family transcriptional regulator, regulator of acetate metabolism
MPHALTGPGADARLARRIVDRMRPLTGADVAFAALLDPAGASFSIGHLAGARTPRLAEIVSRPGVGVGGLCIRLREPVQVSDYPSAATITHEFDAAVGTEGLRAVLAVPFRVGGQLRGAIYGATRRPGRFGERAVSAAVDLADVPPPPGSDGPDLRDRVQQAHAELRAILATVDDPTLRRRLVAVSRRLCGPADGEGPVVALSPREIDVLAAASLGSRNDEIAEALGLSALTVKSYLKSAMAKLDSHNRTEAVRLARRMGHLP